MFKKSLPILLFFGATMSSSAFAIDLTFTGMSLPNAQTAKISVNGSAFTSVSAGQLNFSSSNGGTVSSYCTDALSFLNSSSSTYSMTGVNLNTTTKVGVAGTILANSQLSATTAAQQAGLQLAVWSALYNGGSEFNANGPNFKVTGVSNEVLGFATSYYGSYCNIPDPSLSVIAYNSNQSGSQSQMQVVPEPASLAVLGLGALAMVKRRRKTA